MEIVSILVGLMVGASIMFSLVMSPLGLGGVLLVYAIIMVGFLGLVSQTFWFSYIMFLIILGGVVILFLYIASLSPKVKYKFSVGAGVSGLALGCVCALGALDSVSSTEVGMASGVGSFSGASVTMELYSEGVVQASAYMVVYLLLALVVVVKLATMSSGALRALV